MTIDRIAYGGAFTLTARSSSAPGSGRRRCSVSFFCPQVFFFYFANFVEGGRRAAFGPERGGITWSRPNLSETACCSSSSGASSVSETSCYGNGGGFRWGSNHPRRSPTPRLALHEWSASIGADSKLVHEARYVDDANVFAVYYEGDTSSYERARSIIAD